MSAPETLRGAAGSRPTVLIADGQDARAERIAARIGASGLAVERASNGVDALERALHGSPRLVLAAADLPLVDGPRLASLIASNPRTVNTRFLFLGDRSELGAFAPAVGDRVIAATTRPEEVAEVAHAMLATQDQRARFDEAAAQGEGDEGRLEDLSPPELLQGLLEGRQSGRLELVHEHPDCGEEFGEIVVSAGEATDATSGPIAGEKALFRMLTWQVGRFRLRPLAAGAAPQVQILRPTLTLLAESQRQRSESARLGAALPAFDARIRLCVRPAELPVGVHPLTQEVLSLLDGVERVDEVVDQCSFPDYQVLRTLHTLEERGLVTLHRSKLAHERRGQEGLFTEPQIRRLREWIRESQGRPRRPRDGKLIVSACDTSAVADFANLLRPVRGVELADEVERNSLSAEHVAPLGRLAVDHELGIEMVHLPSRPRFDALWPLAAHGSLGVLCLLSGPVGPAVEHFRPFLAALEDVPRARIFYAVLLGKDDRISPDELREQMELIDDGSLALIPLETAKEPAVLLASLFSRVVP